MRRRAYRALSALLGAVVCGTAAAQSEPTSPDEHALDYGIEPYEHNALTQPPEPPQESPWWRVIRGTVRSSETGEPIQGIYVRAAEARARSARNGAFVLRFREAAQSGSELVIQLRDVDGRAQGGEHQEGRVKLLVTEQGLEPAIPAGGLVVELALVPEQAPDPAPAPAQDPE